MKKLNFKFFSHGFFFAALLTILLSCCVSGLFARYTTEAFGFDAARGAKWDVTLKNASTKLILNDSGAEVSQETMDYQFSLTSHSEVALGYSVKLEFNTPPLANVSLRLSDGTVTRSAVCDGTQTIFTFEGFDYAVGEEAKTLTLTVAVDYIAGDKLIDFNTFTDTVTLSVTAEQKAPSK